MDFAAQLAFIGEKYLFWLLPFLFVLTLVVFFHELGHFLVARWCGVTVKAFSIGFGREIFGFNDSKGTRWRFAWIPLGGYVKFIDDENAASVPDTNKHRRVSKEEREGTFHDKPLPARTAVVAAGPIANFILAIVIFAAMFTFVGERFTQPVLDVAQGSTAESAGFEPGDVVRSINGDPVESFEDVHRIVGTRANRELAFTVRRDGTDVRLTLVPKTDELSSIMGLRRFTPAEVDEVSPGSPADKAGFQPGDKVVRIGDEAIQTFGQMQTIVGANPGKELTIVVQRDGHEVTLKAVPKLTMVPDRTGEQVERGLLGIRRNAAPGDGIWKRYDPLTAVWMGAERTWFVASTTLSYLYDVITGRQSADQLGGPIRIAKVSGDVAKAGFLPLINLAAVLSVSIGLLNLFPIPMLDGGHLLYYGIEAARGRPLSERAQEIGFRIGLALVLMLMIWATRNDLIHIRLL
jgi:regulator of sigma E protease